MIACDGLSPTDADTTGEARWVRVPFDCAAREFRATVPDVAIEAIAAVAVRTTLPDGRWWIEQSNVSVDPTRREVSVPCRYASAGEVTIQLTAQGGPGLTLVASSGCRNLAERYESCWTAVNCAVITDATAKTTCETTKKAFTAGIGETTACEGSVATAAETCLTNFKENAPKAADTVLEVAKYCGCTG